MSSRFTVTQAMNPGLLRGVRAPLVVLVLAALIAAPGRSHGQVSHCEPEEQTLWSCEAKRKTYSVCASGDLDGSKGYMQYRAGVMPAIEFRYPEDLRHPRDMFTFALLAKGASLEFENEGHRYTIVESVMGSGAIDVSKGGRELASIRCETSTDTLTLTTTIDQMKAVGIAE